MKGSAISSAASQPVAVVDIGSTFMRLLIAERRGDKSGRILERAVQSVPIGRDVVRDRRISNSTIERCVQILGSFRQLLKEYGIEPESVRAVTNEAVRQADNHEAFLDRLSIASRIAFRLLDSGQMGYYYHLAFRLIRNRHVGWETSGVAVVEIGGLTCNLLYRKEGEIRFAQTYGVGSLRILQQLESAGLRLEQLDGLAEGRTRELASQLRQISAADDSFKLLFMGREMRFAAERLRSWSETGDKGSVVRRILVSELRRLVRQVMGETVAEEVRQCQISYPDAELLAPTLCMALSVAQELHLKEIYVSNLSFSDGLLVEAVNSPEWLTTMMRHVMRIAHETGAKYRYDERHAAQVAKVALELFDLMREEHYCTERHRLLLEIASLLHDIGNYVNTRGHHKHTMYLIRNTEFTGLSSSEVNVIALIARYHRKALPQMTQPEYSALSREDRLVVCKLAALLRVADALDRLHEQSLGRLTFELKPDMLVCVPGRRVETSAEQVALVEKGDLFEQIYGRRCYVRNAN
jgi:exopolyphosphatase/guanosine-5'-triphosphate,3'-diphosphate pyrophosphatase